MPIEITRFENGAPEEFGALFHETHGPPRMVILLRPHKSLTPEGFVWFVGLTAGLLSLPLLALLGSPVLWGLLPFILIAILALWIGLKRSWRDRALYEELVIWPQHLRLTHKAPRKPAMTWDANPYWVQLKIRPEGGKVENYVTLKGETREVEIGAFLSPAERRELHDLLAREI